MTTECRRVQELLAEHGGSVESLAPSERLHVVRCAECSAVAAQERELTRLLRAAQPQDDALLTQRILEAVRRRRWSRRVARLLPLAASLFLVLAAVAMLGGLPGAGLLAAIPGTSLTGSLGLGGALLTWLHSLEIAARALAGVVPQWASVVGLGAVVVLLSLTRRLARRVRDGAP